MDFENILLETFSSIFQVIHFVTTKSLFLIFFATNKPLFFLKFSLKIPKVVILGLGTLGDT